ncbi:nose resistant to fluoxetine protein 6-like [Mizuhopecten yessoensis]|uniref:Nose resistant to fluoxetine protein 6 n=1 Tax=Mizuhopecten yessoensis TaxID=6573 RepID=A0A210PZ16_MIZYE|nr:nose resistant to fluoxetine protein 6-like [Mizuhopecten yessoensis]OWF41722.1 Nose resistant to fluoxetine protein 6 [Mizuhopecten yessoensis]
MAWTVLLLWTICVCLTYGQQDSYSSLMEGLHNLPERAAQTQLLQSQIMNSDYTKPGVRLYSMTSMLSPLKRDSFLSSLEAALPLLRANITQYNVSETCLNHTEKFVIGLVERQMWSFRMLDAVGKPPSALLNFNLNWFGSYEECKNITIPAFRGKYCSVNFPLVKSNGSAQDTPVAMGMGILPGVNIGVCVPDSCSGEDVSNLINTVFSVTLDTIDTGSLTLDAGKSICQENELELDTKAIVVLVIASLFLALMVIATLYDLVCIQWPTDKLQEYETITNGGATFTHKIKGDEGETQPLLGAPDVESIKAPGMLGQALLAFSIYSNACKILNTHQGSGSITCMNGVRFLSMSWVLLGHSFAFGLGMGDNLLTFLPEMVKTWTAHVILNALVSVDSFFTISGLLLSYLVLKEMKKKNGKLNWGMFYFHRFWRLTPPYMLLMMVYVPLFRYMFEGPKWMQGGSEQNFCADTWWTNLLYINNFVRADKMCMGWSWYLANDMQFYVLSPLMLVPLFFVPTIGLIVCLVFLLAVLITAGVISSVEGMPPTLIGGGGTPAGLQHYFMDYYIVPYCRMGTYVVGIITGYILYKTDCRCRINRYVNLVCWLVAAAVAMSVVYGLYDPVNGHPLSIEVSALYNTTNRIAWGASLCWVIFACATGNGGYVNTLLSWKAFIPLSRLTYCGYLIHPIIMFAFYFSHQTPIHFDIFTMIMYYLGFLCLSFMAAFVISLAFEAPFMGLEKVLFKRERSEKKGV